MLTLDDAITAALRKYREVYANGALPPGLENRACLTTIPGADYHSVVISYGLHGQMQPFVFFQAEVDKITGNVMVSVAQDPSILASLDLSDDQIVR
jgi:hypothetical protein